MTPNAPLIAALDGAYEAFAGYPRPQRMDAAPTRDPTKIIATLSSAPLRNLTGEQIGPYAGWALTTVGSVADYKHCLPRILEQAVRAPEWMGTQPQIIAARLKRADWRNWPQSEQSAILKLFRAAWEQSSGEAPELSGADASQWLCGIAALGENTSSLLAQWLDCPREGAVLQIASLAVQIASITSPDPYEQIFWADVDTEARVGIAEWLLSSKVQTALNDAAGVSDENLWSVHEAQKALKKHTGQVQH